LGIRNTYEDATRKLGFVSCLALLRVIELTGRTLKIFLTRNEMLDLGMVVLVDLLLVM
jgi:hypothetical protein